MSYQDIVSNCKNILKKCGRDKDSLKIIAVSKLQPIEKIRELYEIGHRAFGENYVQEATEKQSALADLSIEWHFIGSLQKNKAKQVVGKFALIHSVDSLKLAQTLSRLNEGPRQKVLLQVNVARETSKGGFEVEELLTSWPELQSLAGIEVMGLMTMPPLTENPEAVRPYFRELKTLADKLSLQELSMGTSHDYQVAIEEGATIVRLGTVLFGERTKHRT